MPETEDTLASTHQFGLWRTAEEAGLVSDGLTFDDFVALNDGVAIGPGAEGIEVDDILNILQSWLMMKQILWLCHSTLLSPALTPL